MDKSEGFVDLVSAALKNVMYYQIKGYATTHRYFKRSYIDDSIKDNGPYLPKSKIIKMIFNFLNEFLVSYFLQPYSWHLLKTHENIMMISLVFF
jgi:hypothetical protein